MTRGRRIWLAAFGLVALSCALCWSGLDGALAQASRNPFSVGVSEAGGQASGLTGWILAQQQSFYRMLTGAVRATRDSAAAFWTLAGLSFAYGVFHAAGPGHGKALISSYIVANERALKRGVAITCAASALQALVAIAIVGVGAVLFRATARDMTALAAHIETASYGAIAALGMWLVWRKARALWRDASAVRRGDDPAAPCADCGQRFTLRYDKSATKPSAFSAGAPVACGHVHAPDPTTLGAGFSWRSAAATIFAAGARPCSGAIIVLVFALAQGVFAAGIGATLAMSLGTAITTSALAALAVLFKDVALRVAGAETRGLILLRALELAAACAVLALGAGLLSGALATGGA